MELVPETNEQRWESCRTSSKDFTKLASDLMSSTTVLHIDQQELDKAMALADSWEDTLAVVRICSMHDAQCIFRDGKIEFRHVTGQTEPEIIIRYDAAQMQLQGMLIIVLDSTNCSCICLYTVDRIRII